MSLADDLKTIESIGDKRRAKKKPVPAKKKPAAKKSNGKSVISKPEVTAQLFAHALVRNSMNATAAYKEIKPDVTDKTAGTEGHKLLKLPETIQILTPLLENLFADAGVETEYVFRRWLEMASGSAADYFTFDKGRPTLDMSDMTPAQRANLKSITISEGKYGTNYKIETYSAQQAISEIAKHLGLLVDKLDPEDIDRIGDLLEKGIKRIKSSKDLDGWKEVILDAEFVEVG